MAAGFAAYWHAQAGDDGLKGNWFQTWRNWVERENAPRSNGAKPMPADSKPVWAIAAGFLDVFEAENAQCYKHNAHQFRDGKRLAEVAA